MGPPSTPVIENGLFVARFEKGEWRYYSRDDLDIPAGTIPARDRVSREATGP